MWPLIVAALLVAGSEEEGARVSAFLTATGTRRPAVTNTSDRRSQPDVAPGYFWMPEDFVTEGGAHVTFRATSGGAYVIGWGTSEFTRELDPRGPHGRGHYPWLAAENEHVLVLEAPCGTGCLVAFVLPLNETGEAERFYLPKVYDMERDLLVHLHGSADTLLAVRNVSTGSVQWVTGPECEAFSIDVCVDSVRIVGDELRFSFWHYDPDEPIWADAWHENFSVNLDVKRLVE